MSRALRQIVKAPLYNGAEAINHGVARVARAVLAVGSRSGLLPAPPLAVSAGEWARAEGLQRIAVLAPHPDDETLGLGATLAGLSVAGVEILVIVVTDGGASRAPLIRDKTAPERAAFRMREHRAALQSLGAGIQSFGPLVAEQHGWETTAEFPRVGAAVIERLRDFGPQILCSTPPFDFHPDHRAVAAIARNAAQELGAEKCRHFYYESQAPFRGFSPTRWLVADSAAKIARAGAINAYPSQQGTLQAACRISRMRATMAGERMPVETLLEAKHFDRRTRPLKRGITARPFLDWQVFMHWT